MSFGEEAFRDATSAGGRFFGFTEANAGTWNGLVANMESRLGSFARNFGQPLMESLKPALAAVNGKLLELMPLATTAGSIFGSLAADGAGPAVQPGA